MSAVPIRFEDVVRRLQAAGSLGEAEAAWQRTVEDLGFTSFDHCFGQVRTPRPRSSLDFRFEHFSATRDWTAEYFERGFVTVDRSAVISLTRSTPWSYNDYLGRPPRSPLEREMFASVRDNGVLSGLAIPLHGPGAEGGMMHLGSNLRQAEFERLDREVRPLAAFLSACFDERVKALKRGVPPPPVEAEADPARARPERTEPVRLTGREREILLWAAVGKTAWETAAILGIAEATANNLLASAKAKLGARTRAHAVARAITLGLIEP